MLDPSCGDGRFLALHRRSVGIEQDQGASRAAEESAPWAAIHEADFFRWSERARRRFDCAAGNPPFIRYQRFNGDVRKRALRLCKRVGADFTALTSSWAPFLVAAASLLKAGGRLAFVCPAEIGHATYAAPLLGYLSDSFSRVQIVAVREKLFPELSEDCWLLYAEGYGERTDHFKLTMLDQFHFVDRPPRQGRLVSVAEWVRAGRRLRPFLAGEDVLSFYRATAGHPDAARLGERATVGIGYVSGANDFFHLTPSEARTASIPDEFLQPTIRNGKMLTSVAVTQSMVDRWLREDQQILLLRIRKDSRVPAAVRRYLATADAEEPRQRYKCRNRDPWYVIPHVQIPDAFLSYMCGDTPALVANYAHCACTNSVHAVALNTGESIRRIQARWAHPFTALSCELEGHPLGGGMLKLEPREAAGVVLPPDKSWSDDEMALIKRGTETMRRWRHCG